MDILLVFKVGDKFKSIIVPKVILKAEELT
jgi:hypothetical protein